MGFEKAVSFFKDNWSGNVEDLFEQSFEFFNEDIYPKLFELFCEKKYKQGLVYIIRQKSNITKSDVELLSKLVDEYTTKEIILTLLSSGVKDYSKILYILENMQGKWVIEFIFYVMKKMNVKSLNIVNVDVFAENLDYMIKDSTINERYNIFKELEKNIEFWRDIPLIWNKCLKYEEMYEVFMGCFFKDLQCAENDGSVLNLIEPQHYINILNFAMKNHYLDKSWKNNFYQFLFTCDSEALLKVFLEELNKMNFIQLSQYAANFSIIPFLKIAAKRNEFNGTHLLLYLFFIYSSGLDRDMKLEAMSNLLNFDRNIEMQSLRLDGISNEFIDVLVNLNVHTHSGLSFIFEVVDKKGDYNFVQKLREKYNEVSDKFKEKINEMFLKYSLKAVILDEKKEINFNSLIEVLKKIPLNVTDDIVSLIYDCKPNIKIRLIKLIELMNYDKGVEKIIETLIYKEKDKKVRATCIRLLKFLKEDLALKHLRILMFDNDPRVRANAVEIFGYFANADNWFVLLALANDDNNRVRGNVAKVVYMFSQKHSLDIIKNMLNSDKEPDVLSALWVIEKLNVVQEFQDILPIIEKKYMGKKIRTRLAKLSAVVKR